MVSVVYRLAEQCGSIRTECACTTRIECCKTMWFLLISRRVGHLGTGINAMNGGPVLSSRCDYSPTMHYSRCKCTDFILYVVWQMQEQAPTF